MENKKILAIINCKALKGNEPMEAEQLYMPSKLFRVQLALIKAYYSGYVILSAGHGIVKPNQKITPYDIALKEGSRVKTQNILSKEQIIVWADKVINDPIWNAYDEIHFFISNTYWNPIKKIVTHLSHKKIVRVKQQVNMGLNIKRYQEALAHLLKTDELDLSIISTHKPSKDPEQKRCFFHSIHGKFFGFARDLVKKYPEIDEGNLYRVSKGKAKQTRGWVINKNDVKNVSYVNGVWRFKKQGPTQPYPVNHIRQIRALQLIVDHC